jgi:hypothetical protein
VVKRGNWIPEGFSSAPKTDKDKIRREKEAAEEIQRAVEFWKLRVKLGNQPRKRLGEPTLPNIRKVCNSETLRSGAEYLEKFSLELPAEVVKITE